MARKPVIFISAPATAKARFLRSILGDIEVTVSDAFDFASGDSLNETVAQKISKADGVLVVYPHSATNVAFEMGAAIALKKPTFVLLDPLSPIPSFAQSHLYLRSSLRDTDTLRASLTRFAQDLKLKRRKAASRQPKPTDDSKKREPMTSFLAHITRHREHCSPLEIENYVSDILKSTGVQVESKTSARDGGVDCVIWSDRLHRTIGNPILVEVKAGNLDSGRLGNAEMQLQRYLDEGGAQYGILLYFDRKGKRFPQSESLSPAILRFDLEDFARKLQHHSFEEVLLTERNRVLHGGDE